VVHMKLKKEICAYTKVGASIMLKPIASHSLHISDVRASIRLYPIEIGFLHIFEVASSIKS